MVTGGADPLECLLRKIGLEDSEFTPPTAPAASTCSPARRRRHQVHPRLNGGADFPDAKATCGTTPPSSSSTTSSS
jgi:hypothetical protein